MSNLSIPIEIWSSILLHTEPPEFYNLSLTCYEAGVASLILKSKYKSRYIFKKSFPPKNVKDYVYIHHLDKFVTVHGIAGTFYRNSTKSPTPKLAVIMYHHHKYGMVYEIVQRVGRRKYTHIIRSWLSDIFFEYYSTTNGIKTGLCYIYNNHRFNRPYAELTKKSIRNIKYGNLSTIKYYYNGINIMTLDMPTMSVGGILLMPLLAIGAYLTFTAIKNHC